ncbi:hypothetical protein QTP86_008000 [Hemibagrus guttatus]|nr:hypothetical protein QTP86_008000 [Hemibagrus guttatus]
MARGEIDLRVIKVIINVLPSIRTRNTELNATADIEQAVTLACYADGFPEPTVTWMRNKVELVADEKYGLNDDGSELTIKDVKKLDEGDYTCIARNKAGEKQEEISLKVFVQPKITYLKNQTASELEEQTVLTCEATGDPTPSIVWSFGRRIFSEEEQASWTRPEKLKVYPPFLGRISNNDELVYREEIQSLSAWCSINNLTLNATKTKELIVDFRKFSSSRHSPIYINGSEVEHVSSFKFLGAHISEDLSWHQNTSTLSLDQNVIVHSDARVSSLTLKYVQHTDAGQYLCIARNTIGQDIQSMYLEVR